VGRSGPGWRCAKLHSAAGRGGEKADYAACVLGLHYVNKSGFSGVVIGLSGGVDSSPR
jgi:hypothetical protein